MLMPGAPPGVVSNHLHDRTDAGDVILVGPPCGEFTLDANLPVDRPVVLLSGGVGLTPLLSMLHTLAAQDNSRPVWFVHAALHSGTHALAHEVRALAAASPNIRTHFRYSRPLDADHEPRRYDSTGYLDAALLKELNVPAAAEYYLCGPRPFMSAVFQQLNLHGVPLDKIHYEFFGPRQEVLAPAPPQAVGAA